VTGVESAAARFLRVAVSFLFFYLPYSKKTCNVSMAGKEKENMKRKGNSVVLARWQADHR
jgi:hypothetical protein